MGHDLSRLFTSQNKIGFLSHIIGLAICRKSNLLFGPDLRCL